MTGAVPNDPTPPGGDDTAALVAQLRELAGADPTEVRQVVAEVLGALDRAAGGALRDHLPAAVRADDGLDIARN
ncbi:hypothetical protein [Micromonospora sp. WMMD708]|uniref:hypothetical protein n=1 Tax=Micromonospora sp. WMMD708 TaxID=3403464 RepID=UPI003BF5F84B